MESSRSQTTLFHRRGRIQPETKGLAQQYYEDSNGRIKTVLPVDLKYLGIYPKPSANPGSKTSTQGQPARRDREMDSQSRRHHRRLRLHPFHYTRALNASFPTKCSEIRLLG